MFKLESNRLKREFKIANNTFFASQILNKYSDMSFVPDGNGTEFTVRFTDGEEFSSKGLAVKSSGEEEEKLKFVFEENMGVTVTVEYWIHGDGNTICKQIILDQSDEREIDFVLLENIGIVNSTTHFGVERVEGSQIPYEWAALGQPFYIDSLFFGCEFPGSDNRIIYGTGRIKYYIGKNVGKGFACPVTVMGAAKDNSFAEVKKAFGEYLDFISTNIDLKFTFNTWFDNMGKTSAQEVSDLFGAVNTALSAQDAGAPDCYVIDDGWCSYKSSFWEFNKKFPNGLEDISAQCRDMNSSVGLWLSPRGGYTKSRKLAKKIQKAGNGYINEVTGEICVASEKYVENICQFMTKMSSDYGVSLWKLDGFAIEPCNEKEHDHMSGGKYDMYFVTDMWLKWVELFKKYRASGEVAKNAWINLTCFVNPSPWWLQWVNSIWIQNSDDIGFCDNVEEQSRLDSMLTYRDSRYYDAFSTRSYQLPFKAVFNHEPIYAKGAELELTDEEFEKYLFWNAARGAALNEFYISPSMMNDAKWASVAKVMRFQKENFDLLKNTLMIGGNPEENNIYGYVSWCEKGGIIALRNPVDEEAELTLTLNKLMGVPEELCECRRINVYCKSLAENNALYSYNDKLDIKLAPFETVIFKFAK